MHIYEVPGVQLAFSVEEPYDKIGTWFNAGGLGGECDYRRITLFDPYSLSFLQHKLLDMTMSNKPSAFECLLFSIRYENYIPVLLTFPEGASPAHSVALNRASNGLLCSAIEHVLHINKLHQDAFILGNMKVEEARKVTLEFQNNIPALVAAIEPLLRHLRPTMYYPTGGKSS